MGGRRRDDTYRQLRQTLVRVLDPSSQPSSRDYEQVLSFLGGYISRHFPFVQQPDREDHASEAMARMLAAARAARVDFDNNPVGYLTAIAGNIVRDQSRSAAKRSAGTPVRDVEDLRLPDEAAAARLEQVATVELVRTALRVAVDCGDETAVRVVVLFLDRAQLTGERPSNREIALALDRSHTGVANALVRFRDYVRERNSQGSVRQHGPPARPGRLDQSGTSLVLLPDRPVEYSGSQPAEAWGAPTARGRSAATRALGDGGEGCGSPARPSVQPGRVCIFAVRGEGHHLEGQRSQLEASAPRGGFSPGCGSLTASSAERDPKGSNCIVARATDSGAPCKLARVSARSGGRNASAHSGVPSSVSH